MERFHLDAHLRVIACENPNCSIDARAHFESYVDALGAVNLTRELESFAIPHRQLNFQRAYSAKTNQYFLEASLQTPLNEQAIFTVEETNGCFRGTMLYTGQEIVLANMTDYVDDPLAEAAKLTAMEADRLYGFDLWPDQKVVDLYDNLRSNSTDECISAPRVFYLDRLESPVGQQHYSGETITGTRIQVRAGHGYAVAVKLDDDEAKIVHESNIARAVFQQNAERDAFVAKAFGRLLALGEI